MKRMAEPALAEIQPAPALIGYARVSTAEQSLDMQIEALEKVGCLNIYQEKRSGGGTARPELDLAIMDLRPGDTLIVWRLDRLARSMVELHKRLAQIDAAGAKFRSLTEQTDFGTVVGKLILSVLGALAQFERDLTIERTKAGMETKRRQGVILGRERKIDDKARVRIVAMVLKGKEWPDIAKAEGVAVSTLTLNFKGGKRKILLDAANAATSKRKKK